MTWTAEVAAVVVVGGLVSLLELGRQPQSPPIAAPPVSVPSGPTGIGALPDSGVASWVEGYSPDEATPGYGVGTRLLVSGEQRWGGAPLGNAIAWGCGFTRYYDAQTAAAWTAATK